MTLIDRRSFSRVVGAAGLGTALLFSVPDQAQAGPFSALTGKWTGTGTVHLSDGSKERIRCRASYKVGDRGDALKQHLRCASDSYRFDLSSDVTSHAGQITGTWSEESRSLYGDLRGRVRGEEISVFVQAAGFAASLSLVTHGNRQRVSIESKGEIRGVSITLVRS